MTIKTPLYGHVSEATAYNVDDYPYGFTARTRIRYWLESSPIKGYRFVSQTENPKTLRWNAPKKSTYHKVAACMYLDENNHVQYSVVNEYTSAEDALAFAQDFQGRYPQGARRSLHTWCAMKASFCRKYASGEVFMTINGIRQPMSDDDKVRHLKEADVWAKAAQLLAPEEM